MNQEQWLFLLLLVVVVLLYVCVQFDTPYEPRCSNIIENNV